MPRLRVFHWNESEAAPLLERLREAGYEIDYLPKWEGGIIRQMREALPDAVLIDLTRLPSHGREVAIALRGSKATRHLPIVFLDGLPEKVAALREHLPDAVYASSKTLESALRKAMKSKPAVPVVPRQMMERYGLRTVAQKLGIKEGDRVAVIHAPRDYARVIGDVPPGVQFEDDPDEPGAVTLWFIRDLATYLAALPQYRRWAAQTKLWIVWPKQTARTKSEFNENHVREAALELGLVDYKVCAVDATWSALALAVKKK